MTNRILQLKYNNHCCTENSESLDIRNILSHSVTFTYEALLYLKAQKHLKCYTSGTECYTPRPFKLPSYFERDRSPQPKPEPENAQFFVAHPNPTVYLARARKQAVLSVAVAVLGDDSTELAEVFAPLREIKE